MNSALVSAAAVMHIQYLSSVQSSTHVPHHTLSVIKKQHYNFSLLSTADTAIQLQHVSDTGMHLQPIDTQPMELSLWFAVHITRSASVKSAYTSLFAPTTTSSVFCHTSWPNAAYSILKSRICQIAVRTTATIYPVPSKWWPSHVWRGLPLC